MPVNSLTIPKILLVEDDPVTAQVIRETLFRHYGEQVVTHIDRLSRINEVDIAGFNIVLADLNLPDGSGLELLELVLEQTPDMPVIIVTSESCMRIAMRTIALGAYDFILKSPNFVGTLPLTIEKNLAFWRTKQEKIQLEQELTQTMEELRVKNQQLQDAVDQLEEQAMTDPLTNLANRRHMTTVLERAFAESIRYHTDLACLMIDLDGFKQINDTCGHQTGDKLLQVTGRVLTANCRRCDIAGRYGGDEFIVLLAHTDPVVAMQVARRIQQQFVTAVGPLIPPGNSLNMSVGIACVSLSRPTSADQLVALADGALYRAKEAGKARIITHVLPSRTQAPAASAVNTTSGDAIPAPSQQSTTPNSSAGLNQPLAQSPVR